jgi:hypothetical protein
MHPVRTLLRATWVFFVVSESSSIACDIKASCGSLTALTWILSEERTGPKPGLYNKGMNVFVKLQCLVQTGRT